MTDEQLRTLFNLITIPVIQIKEGATMSTLELVLYILLGTATLIYAIHVIRKAIKKKKVLDNKDEAPIEIEEKDNK